MGQGTTVGTGRIFYKLDENLFDVNSVAFGLGDQYQGGYDVLWKYHMTAVGTCE